MKKRLGINGVIIVAALALALVFPTLFFRDSTAVYYDEVAEVFGVAFILLGQLLRTSARGYKSEHSRQGESLISSGPYSLVRNPMYLGILLIGLGIVLMLFRWWVAAVFIAVFILRYVLLIFTEEKKLLKIFPQEYPAYKMRVPRLWPSPHSLFQRDLTEYLPLRLSWIKREIGTILAVLLLTLVLESWEDIKQEGLRAYFKAGAGLLLVLALFIWLSIYLMKRTDGLRQDVSV